MAEIFELFPVVCGVILGLLLSRVPARPVRVAAWALGSVCLGLLATLLSGEWRLGWEYLLFDIPAVAAVALAACAALRGWTLVRAGPVSSRSGP